METDKGIEAEGLRSPDELDECMLAIFGILNRPVDYQWIRLYLPKQLDEQYRRIVLDGLSEATTWHFGTAANQYIADRLGPLIEPTPLIGFQLTEDKGEDAYETLLETSEAHPENHPHIQEIFDRVRIISQTVTGQEH